MIQGKISEGTIVFSPYHIHFGEFVSWQVEFDIPDHIKRIPCKVWIDDRRLMRSFDRSEIFLTETEAINSKRQTP